MYCHVFIDTYTGNVRLARFRLARFRYNAVSIFFRFFFFARLLVSLLVFLAVTGESASANIEGADAFKATFDKIVEENG